MKAMAQKFGGGGQEQSPAQAAAELAGKRLIPGHALPHVVLHTVQVCRKTVLVCLGTRVTSSTHGNNPVAAQLPANFGQPGRDVPFG